MDRSDAELAAWCAAACEFVRANFAYSRYRTRLRELLGKAVGAGAEA
jgi:hypothetical protein